MNFNTQGRCRPPHGVYTGLYQCIVLDLQKKAVNRQMLLITTMCIFCNKKTLMLAIRNGSGQTKVLLIITLCLLVSTLLITFASGLDKIRSNKIISLICPNLNLKHSFIDALLKLFRKKE